MEVIGPLGRSLYALYQHMLILHEGLLQELLGKQCYLVPDGSGRASYSCTQRYIGVKQVAISIQLCKAWVLPTVHGIKLLCLLL